MAIIAMTPYAKEQCGRRRVVPGHFDRGENRNKSHEDDHSNGSGQAVSPQLCLAKLDKRGSARRFG